MRTITTRKEFVKRLARKRIDWLLVDGAIRCVAPDGTRLCPIAALAPRRRRWLANNMPIHFAEETGFLSRGLAMKIVAAADGERDMDRYVREDLLRACNLTEEGE